MRMFIKAEYKKGHAVRLKAKDKKEYVVCPHCGAPILLDKRIIVKSVV